MGRWGGSLSTQEEGRSHSARTVPAQCPHSARTVPVQCPLGKQSISHIAWGEGGEGRGWRPSVPSTPSPMQCAKCFGFCAGTVRALCGHCAGTVVPSFFLGRQAPSPPTHLPTEPSPRTFCPASQLRRSHTHRNRLNAHQHTRPAPPHLEAGKTLILGRKSSYLAHCTVGEATFFLPSVAFLESARFCTVCASKLRGGP